MNNYSVVPSQFMKDIGSLVAEVSRRKESGKLHVAKGKKQEQLWLEQGRSVLESGTYGPDKTISWVPLHVSRQKTEHHVPPVTSMIPLFNEKADSPAMVKHGMEITRKTIHFLNIAKSSCDGYPIMLLQNRFSETSQSPLVRTSFF